MPAAKSPRAKPKHPEAVQQRLFVARVRLDARTRDVLFCAVPNGGKRGAREAALLKAEGVSAGVPDLMFFEPREIALGNQYGPMADIRAYTYTGLAMEFKIKGNGPTPAQRGWHRALAHRGWCVRIVYSAQEAWDTLTNYLGVPQ